MVEHPHNSRAIVVKISVFGGLMALKHTPCKAGERPPLGGHCLLWKDIEGPMTTNRHQHEQPTDIVQRIIDSPWPMVSVRWVDAEARGGPGWEDLEEMIEFAIRSPAEVLTVGLLMYENDDYVALTDTRSPDLTGGVQKIPKGWIIAIEHLVADTRTNPLSIDQARVG